MRYAPSGIIGTPQPIESLKSEQGEAIEGNAADDIVIMDQGTIWKLTSCVKIEYD